jgi:phosphoribosyl-ATP pyrophosphohydrolase/phosphoribosyl-AMP cyclohydrolase/histidinol dehydrogenase
MSDKVLVRRYQGDDMIFSGLRRLELTAVPQLRRAAVDGATLDAAARIVQDVRDRGEAALRHHAERLGDLAAGEPLFRTRADMLAALDGISTADRDVLERTADRIRAFAQSQRSTLGDLDVAVPGGRAGHTVVPVVRAGCYAPGGRFPLPSSVLMTAVTARVAGVPEVIVASPRPAKATLAAAAVAGADILLAAGGAHAIAAMAYGAGPVPPCDAIVGPGNRWVTAAKQLVSGPVVIDMLAGPSELVVLADGTADPDVVAADLIAQAEHDPDALPILVTTAGETFACAVDDAIARRLVDLPTAATAIPALQNGFTVLAPDLDAAIAVCDRLAPEHLEVKTLDPKAVAARLRHYGALFVGSASAEVFGDYGAGPNHVLPTGGTARSMGGLSVLTFLRVRTWLCLDDAAPLLDDAARLARMEGLEGHARAAEARKVIREPVPGFSHATAALKESK